MKAKRARPVARILGVEVDAVDMEAAVANVETFLREGRKGYVCVTSVHGIMEAQRSLQITQAHAGSQMTIPDGMPLAWVGRIQGHPDMTRVTGPDLMLEVFRRKEFSGATHFLYGGAEGVADELREKLAAQFPWVRIVGICTPPFRELLPAEEEHLIALVGNLRPDIVWVGLGCPKQELFMSHYLAKLDTRLMFGVGAAFDFHTGRVRDCAAWVKLAGLQWLHRLLQDPARLWRRYLRNNPAFLWRVALQLTGIQRYPQAQAHPAKPQKLAEERHRAEVHS